MPTPTTYPSAKSVVALAVETTQGTANTTPAATLLLDDPLDVEDKPVQIPNNGMYGSMTDRYGTIQGPMHTVLSGKGHCHLDTLPYLINNIFGDVVTSGPVTSQYTHAFSLLNSGTAQPGSLTVIDWQGLTGTSFARMYAGFCLSELVIKGNPESTLIDFSFKGLAYPSADYPTAPPVFSPSTDAPLGAWRVAMGLAGPASGGTLYRLQRDWTVTMTREARAQFTSQNSQAPYVIQRGKLLISGSAYISVPSDETVLDYLLNNTRPQIQYLADNGGAAAAKRSLQIDVLTAAFESVKINRSEETIGYDVTWNADANTTNAGASGGFSPGKITVVNATVGGGY